MKIENATIREIGELKTFNNTDFRCIDLVVETNEQYPQKLKLQANNKTADNLLKYNKVDDVVNISINLRGREWTNPQGEVYIFNTIEAWKVEKSQNETIRVATINELNPTDFKENTNDDLPF